MKLASFLSAAAVLGTATMASAVVNVIVTQNGAIGSVDDPGVAGNQNLTSYTIAFDNTGVANIGGFDFLVQGTPNTRCSSGEDLVRRVDHQSA